MRRKSRTPASAPGDHPLEAGLGAWVVLGLGFLLLALNPSAAHRGAYIAGAAAFSGLAVAGWGRRALRLRRLRRRALLRSLLALGGEVLPGVLQLPAATVAGGRLGVGDVHALKAGDVVIAPRGASPQARSRARKLGVRLLNPGDMLRRVERLGIRTSRDLDAVAPPAAPACPACGSGMVLRHSRRPGQIDSSFWGCPRFPGCRGTRPLSPRR